MARERNPCVCVSTRTGSLIIGWVTVVATVVLVMFVIRIQLGISNAMYNHFCIVDGDEPETNFKPCLDKQNYFAKMASIAFAVGIVALLPPISLIYGAFKNRATFVIPFIAYQILGHIGLLVWLFYLGVHPLSIFPYSILLVFWAYVMVVVCFHYIKLRKAQRSVGEVKMSAMSEATNI